MNKTNSGNELCLDCGLCCNGVIFGRGQLKPEDDADKLRRLGLRLKKNHATANPAPKFLQPCAALTGCRCRIYPDRPRYCQEFDCLLLKNLVAGHTSLAGAQRTVRTARRRVKTVHQLLMALGETDQTAALSLRFRRVQRRLESGDADSHAGEIYGKLTLAIHDLNRLLGEKFYR